MNHNDRKMRDGIEYRSSIPRVRALEDCIRATRKYTKGAFSKPLKHPMQGEDVPSKVLTEYYEVYPETEIGWDMPAGVAIDWLWQDVPCIDVYFHYDYRNNTASLRVVEGQDAVKKLIAGITGFGDALSTIIADKYPKKEVIIGAQK